MDFSEGSALEIVERLCSAYGVTTQKALAKCLGVPAANVSNWVQRDSVPGSAFVKCALDTGNDLRWLTTGKLANAKFNSLSALPNGKGLYDEITSNGGKAVLRRIMDAYGFTLQKQLCELFGISSGTVSTWIRRNYFPGDLVVTCALDTGVPLQWLATGKGKISGQSKMSSDINIIKKKNLIAGALEEGGEWQVELSFLQAKPSSPIFVSSNTGSWLIDTDITSISNGRWLLGIDGKYDIYDVAILPNKKISLTTPSFNFICASNEVSVAGKVFFSLTYNF
ncbi:phage repressor protein CI [Pantoea agglomerans]|uniref:phage repressor protein CI n=1 Tax=Enterobacter agglomerans TaxID=549 RepID=UPI003C7BB2AC